jgi:multiple inositol-polyphosphate phosphatase/2,3-bisphosphoglycerate 3-phosphatase
MYSNKDLNSKNGIFYFTHSGTILKMFGVLGLFKDENELKHDNYIEMKNRQWRTSKIDAFASNLAFVLYEYEINVTPLFLCIDFYNFYL